MILTFTEKNGAFHAINVNHARTITCNPDNSVTVCDSDGHYQFYEITPTEKEKIKNFFQKPLDN